MKIWPEGNLCAERAQRGAAAYVAEARQRRAGASVAPITFSKIATPPSFVHNAQMEPRSCVANWEGDKLTVYTPTGGIANCRHDIARDLGHARRKVRVDLPVHGRRFRQQEPESGCRPDYGDAREGSGRAGEARVLAQGRLHRHARPLADRSVLQGRRDERRHAAGDPAARLSAAWDRTARTAAAIGGIELYECANIESVDHAGVHEQDRLGEFPRAGVPAGLLRHRVDDGRRRRTR